MVKDRMRAIAVGYRGVNCIRERWGQSQTGSTLRGPASGWSIGLPASRRRCASEPVACDIGALTAYVAVGASRRLALLCRLAEQRSAAPLFTWQVCQGDDRKLRGDEAHEREERGFHEAVAVE